MPRDEELPQPRLPALTLLVGRITTIKLLYWGVLTLLEVGLGAPALSYGDAFRWSVAAGVLLTLGACAWAAWSARAPDRRVGLLERSIPTVATAFLAAAVVASPASLPLLIVQRQRSVEGCFPSVCHWDAIWWWVAALAAGTVLIPLVFAARLRTPGAQTEELGPRSSTRP